jgi:hypothetical protein
LRHAHVKKKEKEEKGEEEGGETLATNDQQLATNNEKLDAEWSYFLARF